jgi:hypothetical protein
MDRLDCVFLMLVIITIALISHALDTPQCGPGQSPQIREPVYHTI